MQEYHKIETVYERDMNGTKKLIEGKFRNETIEFLKDSIWQFTEKIDGTNIRVHWDGHKIEFGGRTERASIPVHLMNKLNDIFSNVETEELFEQMFGEKDVILFGEGYGAKIQKVGASYRPDVGFILFDIMINGMYLARRDVEQISTSLGLEVVPIILEATIPEAVEFVKTKPKSTIGHAPMEGVVGRPKVELFDRTGKRLIVKIKACDFETPNTTNE